MSHASARHPRLRSLAGLGLAVVLLAGCRSSTPPATSQTAGEDVVPVGAEPVQLGSLRATVHVSGSVVPADGAEFLVVAPEPARVIEVTRNQGEPVNAGDLLVRFELPGVTQELARQQADLAQLQARVENARVNRQRVADFVERGLVARNDLNQAERELTDAQDAVAAAAAAVKRSEETAARASVRAPFSGIVATRLHNPGDLVQASATDPVLRVVDPTRLEVLAAVPGADASRVVQGATARVAGLVVDGQAIPLVVAGRPSAATDSQGRLPIRMTFMAPHALAVDSMVEIDIDAEERSDVVFVPQTALVGSGQDAAVFVAADDVAERRAVTLGVTTERGVEILSGLQAGELVITRGQDVVRHGTRISAAVTR